MTPTGLVEKIGEAICGKPIENLNDFLHLTELLGLDTNSIKSDLKGLLTQRILMWLLKKDSAGNFNERTRALKRRLKSLANLDSAKGDHLDVVISELAKLEGEISTAHTRTKTGIGSTTETALRDILTIQGERCVVCGVPFKSNVRRESHFRVGQIEPLGEMHLDHVEPFYFRGNATNYEVLCLHCNAIKNDRFGVQEDGFVMSSNHLRPKDNRAILRRMAFWTFYRNRGCSFPQCQETAATSMLFASQSRAHTSWSYGNLLVKCDIHAQPGDFHIHPWKQNP